MPRTERCRIAAVRSAAPGEWDAIWTGCDHATYFHSRDWAEIWQTYTEGAVRPDPRVIQRLIVHSCVPGRIIVARRHATNKPDTPFVIDLTRFPMRWTCLLGAG